MRSLRVAVVLAFVAAAGWATTREVVLSLPLRSKLQLSGHERLYIGPFVREVRGDEAPAQLKFDVAAEFERFLRKLLRKESKLVILPQLEGVRVPTTDPLELATLADFWRELGMRVNADYVVAGSIEFTVQDTTQPKMESYESPIDGRTYYRQVLVEQTGFEYDIVFQVYDGRTGELLFHDNFKDFKQIEGEKADPLLGMFENLRALEDRIAGVFTQKQVEASRLLLTD